MRPTHSSIPCAAALPRPGVEIEEESSPGRPVAIEDVEIAHVRVVHLDSGTRHDADTIETRHDGEQAGEHSRQREIRTQSLLGDLQALALHPLGEECDVPRLQRPPCERLQFRELARGGRAAHACQLAKEAEHLGGLMRHLGRQRVLGEIGETDQTRGLVAQREDLRHQRCVVPAPGVRASVRCARDPRFVELATQRLGLGRASSRPDSSGRRATGASRP